MQFKYNYFGFPEPANIYLCKTDNTIICELNGIDRKTVSYTKQLNNIATIQFDVHRYIDGEESNGYDLLDEAMYIRVDNIGYFRMSYPETTCDGYDEYKSVTAQSCECELQLKSLVGFKINCGSLDSMEYLYPNNVTETDEGVKIARESIVLYDSFCKQLSLLDLALEKVPEWTIGHVDEKALNSKSIEFKKDDNGDFVLDENGSPIIEEKTNPAKRCFDIDNKSIYAFLTQDVAQKFECMFEFDTFNRRINVYSLENYGKDSGVQIGYTNLVQELKITPATEDNIFTRFNVQGGDSLTIDSVNFGTSTIEDLSYFLNTKHIDNKLIEKYNNWKTNLEKNRNKFMAYMKEYNTIMETRDEINYRVPNDGLKTNWKQFKVEELDEITEKYKGYRDNLKKLYYKDGKWTNKGAELDYTAYGYNSTETPDKTRAGILGAIEATKEYKQKNSVNASSVLDDELEKFLTNWDLYGVVELENKIKAYDENLEALNGYQTDWDSLTSKQKKEIEGKNLSHEAYDISHNKYVKYSKLKEQCDVALYTRKNEYTQYNNQMTDLMDNFITPLKNMLEKKTKEEGGYFTSDELNTLNRLYNDSDYTNENIITISTDTASQIVDRQYELFADAQTEITKVCQPQLTFSLTMDNIFAIPEFREWQGDFDIGNFILLSIGKNDNYFIKLRISSLTWNPCIIENDFQIEFSNMISYSGGRDDFASLMEETVNAAKNQITSKVQSNLDTSGIQVSDALIKALVNSKNFSGAISNGVFDTISANRGVFNELLANSLNAQQIMANSGVFGSADMGTGTAKVFLALDIDASRISVGTLSVERLIIRGEKNSIVYSMNNDLGSVESKTISAADYDKYFVNGKNITANTITAEKILSHSITASQFVADDIRGVNGWINFSSGTFAFYGSDNIAAEVANKKSKIDVFVKKWNTYPPEENGKKLEPIDGDKERYQFTRDFDFTVTDLGQAEIAKKIEILRKYITNDTKVLSAEIQKAVSDYIDLMEYYSLWLDLNDLINKGDSGGKKYSAEELSTLSNDALLTKFGVQSTDTQQSAKLTKLRSFIATKLEKTGKISWDGSNLSVLGHITATSLTLAKDASVNGLYTSSQIDNAFAKKTDLGNISYDNLKNLPDMTQYLNADDVNNKDGRLYYFIKQNGEIGEANCPDASDPDNPLQGYFKVSSEGLLTCTNAVVRGVIYAQAGSFTGNVKATTGNIGGWNIDSGGILYSSTNYDVKLLNGTNSSKDYLVVHVKNPVDTESEYPFYVRADGTMYASKATLEHAVISGYVTSNKILVKDELLMYADGINKTTILSVSKDVADPSLKIGNNNLTCVSILNNAVFRRVYDIDAKKYNGFYFSIDKNSSTSMFSIWTDAEIIEMNAHTTVYKTLQCNDDLIVSKNIEASKDLNIDGNINCKGTVSIKGKTTINNTITAKDFIYYDTGVDKNALYRGNTSIVNKILDVNGVNRYELAISSNNAEKQVRIKPQINGYAADADDMFYLGQNNSYFNTAYINNINYKKLTQISDEQLKTDISSIAQKYIDFFMNLPIYMYKYKNFTPNDHHDRFHIGVKARETAELMKLYGISTDEFGFINISNLEEPNKAGNLEEYSASYLELIGLNVTVTQNNAKAIEQLKSENEQLKKRITYLEKLNNVKATNC